MWRPPHKALVVKAPEGTWGWVQEGQQWCSMHSQFQTDRSPAHLTSCSGAHTERGGIRAIAVLCVLVAAAKAALADVAAIKHCSPSTGGGGGDGGGGAAASLQDALNNVATGQATLQVCAAASSLARQGAASSLARCCGLKRSIGCLNCGGASEERHGSHGGAVQMAGSAQHTPNMAALSAAALSTRRRSALCRACQGTWLLTLPSRCCCAQQTRQTPARACPHGGRAQCRQASLPPASTLPPTRRALPAAPSCTADGSIRMLDQARVGMLSKKVN